MAVTLQVRDVRAEIYKSAGGLNGAGPGLASTALLGRIFHQTFADLVGGDQGKNYQRVLTMAESSLEEWQTALVKHAYERLIGRKLYEHQSELRFVPDQVLTFWDAVQELCGWLAELLWQAREKEVSLEEAPITVEEPLRWEVQEEGWTDSVLLTGVADAVWRLRENQHWCVIELKTGRTAPEADLAQACLYHQMLNGAGINTSGILALVSFIPQKQEKIYRSEELGLVQQGLRRLIGKMAGVIPAPSVPKPAVQAVVEKQMEAPSSDHFELGRRLAKAFLEFGADIKVSSPIVGPTFLRFPIELGRRVSLRTVSQPVENVQIRLGLEAPPKVSLESGRVAIDVQRPDRRFIYFSSIRDQLPEKNLKLGCAHVPVGIDLNGKVIFADFSSPENAHLLAAGTPGSGKSEWLRSAVAGLILSNTAETLRLALVDPKMNAFQMLRQSPFLYKEIAYDAEAAISLFEDLIEEMESRYQKMAAINADKLTDYINLTGQSVPRIFLVCDEYADLMMGERKKRQLMEDMVRKLGQKARAAGIHLILATQQPSAQVLTGTIKGIINARVGLRMPSTQSRMLLEESGTESLLGKGDLLYKCIGDPIRLQSPYLPPEELQEIFGGR
jgi:hypothetical protein